MSATAVSPERLGSAANRVARDSEALLQDTAALAGEKAHELRDRMVQTLEAAKRSCRQLEEKAVEGAKATDKVIRSHPYESLGIAFGVGLLVGILATRR